MKGKIGEYGSLLIQRGKNMKHQYCPCIAEGVHCGDWCPQFGEPRKTKTINLPEVQVTHLDICQDRTLSFTEFTDERERDED